jgi:hypothetical protein
MGTDHREGMAVIIRSVGAVSFAASPRAHAHLSSFDRESTVLHDLYEAWPETACVRNHIRAPGVELMHQVASPFT